MTDNNHPITPPPALAEQWYQDGPEDDGLCLIKYVATQAARWGADMELEACCEWLSPSFLTEMLRAARRPKPPSLKERALAIVEKLGICDHLSPEDERILCQAIESLPE